jgi:hypothetical protein
MGDVLELYLDENLERKILNDAGTEDELKGREVERHAKVS